MGVGETLSKLMGDVAGAENAPADRVGHVFSFQQLRHPWNPRRIEGISCRRPGFRPLGCGWRATGCDPQKEDRVLTGRQTWELRSCKLVFASVVVLHSVTARPPTQ